MAEEWRFASSFFLPLLPTRLFFSVFLVFFNLYSLYNSIVTRNYIFMAFYFPIVENQG